MCIRDSSDFLTLLVQDLNFFHRFVRPLVRTSLYQYKLVDYLERSINQPGRQNEMNKSRESFRLKEEEEEEEEEAIAILTYVHLYRRVRAYRFRKERKRSLSSYEVRILQLAAESNLFGKRKGIRA